MCIRDRTYDTCGVHNLHGLPSVWGGLASAIFVAVDNEADFLHNEGISQAARQVLAVVTTLAVALVSGLFTGVVMKFSTLGEAASIDDYNDAMWWECAYMEAPPQDELDLSGKSKASISPIMIVEHDV